MIPILYEATETAFTTNGICRLYEILTCEVLEERNGLFECNFTYPVDGAHFEDITCGRIIAVKHDDSEDVQPFDIVSYKKPINGVVEFHAVHISYRQSYLVAYGSGINSLADAFTMLSGSEPQNPFRYSADFTSAAFMAAADGTPRSVRQLLGGIEGSILDAYGGEFLWDKFSVKLLRNRGKKRDFSIRYGVNMVDYENDTDFSGAYTSCVPFWKGQDSNGNDAKVIGDRVDTGATPYNGRNDCFPLDMSDKFETMPTKAQLQTAALSEMQSKRTYMPAQTIKIDFVRLQDSAEYESFDELLVCNLCDTITVVFPDYDMQGEFKIVKTDYDALEERYKSMELGTLSVSLSEALGISNGLGGSSGGGGGDKEVNFIVPTSMSWTSVTGAWTPDGAGIATARISPTSSAAAYIIIRDTTNSNKIVCQIYTTNGGGASGCFPVVAGHTYSVGSKSSNVTSMEVYYYKFS